MSYTKTYNLSDLSCRVSPSHQGIRLPRFGTASFLIQCSESSSHCMSFIPGATHIAIQIDLHRRLMNHVDRLSICIFLRIRRLMYLVYFLLQFVWYIGNFWLIHCRNGNHLRFVNPLSSLMLEIRYLSCWVPSLAGNISSTTSHCAIFAAPWMKLHILMGRLVSCSIRRLVSKFLHHKCSRLSIWGIYERLQGLFLI